MPRRSVWGSALCLLVSLGGAILPAAESEKSGNPGLRAGAASVVITPPKGTPLAGYYHARGASEVLDDLYAKALVLECGGERVALVCCDLITLPRHTVLAARGLIEKETGIPAGHVMLSATHTHTGPALVRDSSRDQLDGAASDPVRRYTLGLPAALARCVAQAHARLAPARISAARGSEAGMSFNRRFWMKDGTVGWNPGKNNPQIVRPAGPIDPAVGLIEIASPDGKASAVYVNFAMHPDTTGGTAISADYPGVLARRLAEFYGDDLVTLFANGCCGNINHLNVAWSAGQTRPAEARRLGTILAGAVLKSCMDLKPVEAQSLRTASRSVKLPLPKITAEDIAEARRLAADPRSKFMEKVKAFKVLDVVAQAGKPLEVEVQVIALGNQVAWVSLPGEIFVEIGLDIQRASPFRYTMIAELANGSIGYVPNRSAYAEGNYEVVSARCGEGSGEMLVAAAVELLRQLQK